MESHERITRILKNLNVFKNLINQNEYNFSMLDYYNSHIDEIDDIEFRPVVYALTNFILTASIAKQYIKQFENFLSNELIESKNYLQIKKDLLEDSAYMLLLGLRNYLQHIFGISIGCGDFANEEGKEQLFINSFTMLDCSVLCRRNKENKFLIDYFRTHIAIPIMPFATDIMGVLIDFYNQYHNVIMDFYKLDLKEYKESDNQYAFDLHDLYLDNLYKFSKK